jgi:hypothetical protein
MTCRSSISRLRNHRFIAERVPGKLEMPQRYALIIYVDINISEWVSRAISDFFL